MDVPKINTDSPDCKPLLEQQQKIFYDLIQKLDLLTVRLETVERKGKRQAVPFRTNASRSEEAWWQERRGSWQVLSLSGDLGDRRNL